MQVYFRLLIQVLKQPVLDADALGSCLILVTYLPLIEPLRFVLVKFVWRVIPCLLRLIIQIWSVWSVPKSMLSSQDHLRSHLLTLRQRKVEILSLKKLIRIWLRTRGVCWRNWHHLLVWLVNLSFSNLDFVFLRSCLRIKRSIFQSFSFVFTW